VLRGYRDVPAAKVADVALTLVKLAQLAADVPELRELDINPLLADQNGVLALDVRIAVAPERSRSSRAFDTIDLRCGPVRRMGAVAGPQRRCEDVRSRCGWKTGLAEIPRKNHP
jgi:hypothetical protein